MPKVNLDQVRLPGLHSLNGEENMKTRLSILVKPASPRLALLPLLLAMATVYGETGANVGEVSLVLGKAYLKSGDKQSPVHAGTIIKVSDQVITESNGHVHIRFVDQALISVRPDSTLEIQRYDFNPQSPADSSIKLNLVEGITRAISGDGAHAARDRFRLNTPIAAIGVRGTDFVVSASSEYVRALVNEGSIVMAPFSADCLVSSFGPCASNAVELSQGSLQMVQMDGGAPLARLVPATDERGELSTEKVAVLDTEAESLADDKTAGTEVYLENVTSRRVAEVASNVASNASNNTPTPPPLIVPPKPPVVIDFTPPSALSASSLTSNNLIWGRWKSNDGQGANERISTAYETAIAGRDVTVGNFTYLLFRDGKGSTLVKPDLTVVSFGLSSAQAFYHSDTGVMAMQVNSGSLSVNFADRSFTTQLGLNSLASGKVDFAASGKYNEGGFFHSNTDMQRMAGAVSLDGKEAGYFFEKTLGEGKSVEGLTLWGAP